MTQANNPQILALNKVGQSVWYDNLSRDVLRSGELKGLINNGVSGLTSNPTIFKKAIADTSNYDQDMLALSNKGLSNEDICEELMIEDVAAAADLLKGVYQKSSGMDGYASIEVSPFLARDAAASFEAAKRIWKKLNRPNIMIKIPGTKECFSAIQDTLSEGINVNVTLLFSVDIYEKVVGCYQSALKARADKGQAINSIASVASFFVSRVDAICEERFKKLVAAGSAKESDMESFFGKVGIANALLAYKRFGELFSDKSFGALKAKGAMVQRPLWASTGTKNPKLDPLLYVDELAGDHTVNTMPPATLDALLKSSKSFSSKLSADMSWVNPLFSQLKSLGLDFDGYMEELQNVGVELFAGSYNELLESIDGKIKKLKT